MARTAPVPNIPPIPGMCPSIAVLGGGGGGGGGSGDGAGDGDGNGGAGGDGSGEGASGDGTNGGCAEGDPVCPITGRVVLTLFDFGFGGPLPLRWMRAYGSRSTRHPGELGYGWSHTFGWRIRVKRSEVDVIDDWNRTHRLEKPAPGESRNNGAGMLLRATGDSFVATKIDQQQQIEFGPLCDDGFHYMTALVDRYGNRIVVERKGPRLVGLTDSAGRAYRTRLDERGRIVEILVATDAAATNWLRVVTYTYGERGDLESASDAEGFTGRYAYDNHLLTAHQAPSGITFFYRYDGATEEARCVETWGEYVGRVDPALLDPPPPAPSSGPDRRKLKGIFHVRLTYDPAGKYCEAQNALGGITRYFGDDKGRATKIVQPDGSVTTKSFDPTTGALQAESNSGERKRAVRRDAKGIAAGFQDANGRSVDRRRGNDGVEHELNGILGSVTERRYDQHDDLLFTRHADDTVEAFKHDARGLMIEHTNRCGVTSRFTHDTMGNCVRIERTGGAVETYEYDYLGRRKAHVAPTGARTEWRHDRRSEIVYKRLPDGNEIYVERNAERLPTVVKDSGHVMRFEWGGVKWLVKAVDIDGSTFEYKYDAMGHVVRVTNPRGETFVQEFDFVGRKVAIETFEGAKYRYGFKGLSLMKLDTPTGRFSLERDADARITAMATPDQDIAFEHAPLGLSKLDNGSVPVELAYDPLGRVVLDKQGPNQAKVSWHGGKLAAMTPGRGPVINYDYAITGDVEAVTVGSKRVEVAIPLGEDVYTYLGDNVVLRQKYNVAGSLVAQAVAMIDSTRAAEEWATEDDPRLIFSRKFFYDETSLYPVSEWRKDGTSIEYELDAGKRIKSKRISKNGAISKHEKIAYDPAGTPLMPDAAYARARPTRYANEELEYDAAGRLVARVRDQGTVRYDWNALDQLVRVIDGDRVVAISYDANGRRMSKQVRVAGALRTSLTYLWNRDSVAQEIDELSGRIRTYIRAPGAWQPIGHVDAKDGVEKAYLYVQGPSGGVEMVVDERGTVVWSAELSVYGMASITKSDIDVSLRYTNQFYDEDVGLTYNRFRWYDARVGLYVSPDPWLLQGTLNPRDYVTNPLVQMDPRGLTHPGVGSGKRNNTHHASPTGVPGRPRRPADVDAMDGDYMSRNGHWSRPDMPPPGSEDEPAGYANCPEGALDRGSGFGSGDGSAQQIVDRAGDTYGCHSCGSRKSGWTSAGEDGGQHWTADHVPPRTTYKGAGDNRDRSRDDGAVRLYPHCRNCASRQGGLMSGSSTSDRERRGDASLTSHGF